MRHNKFLDNLCLILVFSFLFLPILVLILFSFNTSEMNIVFEGFTLHWYKDLFSNIFSAEDLDDGLYKDFIELLKEGRIMKEWSLAHSITE